MTAPQTIEVKALGSWSGHDGSRDKDERFETTIARARELEKLGLVELPKPDAGVQKKD